MRKTLFCLTSMILVVGLLMGCSGSNSGAANTDSDKIIHVKVGQEFTISLEANPTTGYDWECTSVYEWIQPLDKTYQVDNTGLVGSSGTDSFIFEAYSQGTATLVFIYKRAWEATSVEQKTFTVEVSQ